MTNRVGNMLSALAQKVCYTRPGDYGFRPGARLKVAAACHADVGFSIHYNHYTTPGPRGFEVWTSKGDTLADPIATRVYAEVQARLPGLPVRKDFADGDIDKERRPNQQDLYMLCDTKPPWLLIEVLFLSNPEDVTLVLDPAFNTLMAEAIAWGLIRGARSVLRGKDA